MAVETLAVSACCWERNPLVVSACKRSDRHPDRLIATPQVHYLPGWRKARLRGIALTLVAERQPDSH